jgi:CubicO group peptidase (beta-lactamase class C family)
VQTSTLTAVRSLGLALLAVSAVLQPSRANNAPEDRQVAAIDELFEQYKQPGSPGVAIGVYKDGQPLLMRGYGYAHLEHDIPISPNTVFHVASVSKQFTAFSVALLAAEGKLDLDEDVRRYLPRVPDLGPKISPRHLVYHTSGLRDQWTLFVLGGMEMDNRLRQSQIVSMIERQTALNFDPGSDYAYSNSGYTLLAELVHSVSGQTLREFTERRIFRPLGMHDTLFYDDVTEIVPNRAQSYEKGDGSEWRRSPLNFDNVGATSLHTTVEDLLAWSGNFLHPTVGAGEALGRMFESGRLDDGTPLNYGFALQKRTIAGKNALWHSGSDAGYRSILAVCPDDDFAVTILANAPADLLVSLEKVASVFLAPGSDAADGQQALPFEIAPDKATVNELVGEYFHENRLVLTLESADDGLAVRVLDDDAEPVVFRDDGSFDFGEGPRLSGIRYLPVRAANGRVTGIEERGRSPVDGRHLVFRKVTRWQPTAAELANVTGTYESLELDVTYRVEEADGVLAIGTLWTGEVTLRPTVENRFEGEWPMHDVAIELDPAGNVIALLISSDRARNVRLERIDQRG